MGKYPTRDELIQDRDNAAYSKASRHNEGPWCDDCRGYTHAPWCPGYRAADEISDAEYAQLSTEQPASAAGSERDDDECAFVHRLVSGNLRCGTLRQHHSQYTGHEFVEPQQPPALAAQETRQWYDHDDPRHIYHTVFNPSGCDKFYCLKRFDATYQSLSAERERLRAALQEAAEWFHATHRYVFGEIEVCDHSQCVAIRTALNEQGKESG